MQQMTRHVLTTQHAVPRCPAPGVDDRRCPRAAGFGTDHPGVGKCRQHELEAAAAARRERAKRIPQAVFLEPVYVDGLPYLETAPAMSHLGAVVDEFEDEPDEWGYDEQGRIVDLRDSRAQLHAR